VSSWKGPELERVSKVRLFERFRVNFGTRLGLANAFYKIGPPQRKTVSFPWP